MKVTIFTDIKGGIIMMTNVLFVLAVIIYLVLTAVSTANKYGEAFHNANENIDETEKEESK